MKTLFVCIISLLLCAQAMSQALTVGDKLPALSVDNCILPGSTNMVVKNISLQNFAGKIIILDFWATWCGPCISSMPKYEKFQKK
jgi:cytochrome c biogenesis protein CcmG/thiol:disulfide interchange protein DsbE